MSRKRRIFDIDMPPVEDIPIGKVPDDVIGRRRGPMATAISENAQALKDQQSAEASIRAENDRLAHEFVRLREDGLVTELVALDRIVSERLKRDRSEGPDPELEELKASIRDVGLSNPIRVEPREDGKFELVQGMRRLSAYRALLLETGDEAYARIPAGLMSRADAVASYRRMVDENLVRKDISFAEMATLARGYAQDPAHDCPDVDKAVGELFKSASYTKRSYIRAFASLLGQLEPFLVHPNAIPRNLGVELKRRMDADETLVDQIRSDLLDMTQRTVEEEAAILRRHAGRSAKEATRQTPGEPAAAKPRTAKTTFQVRSAKGVAKCSASNGRIDLRFDLDFTRIDRSRLERAIEDLLIRLQDDQP